MTIKELLIKTKEAIGQVEAEQLLCAVLGKDRSFFFAHGGDELEAVLKDVPVNCPEAVLKDAPAICPEAVLKDAPAICPEAMQTVLTGNNNAANKGADVNKACKGANGIDSAEVLARVEAMVAERLSGRPLQYVLGTAEFMGLEFDVNEAVLIPRPETELLCEEAARVLDGKIATQLQMEQQAAHEEVQAGGVCVAASVSQEDANMQRGCVGCGDNGFERAQLSVQEEKQTSAQLSVLDVCTGSGCIAVYLAHEFYGAKKDAKKCIFAAVSVTASDISAEALAVAKGNAAKLLKNAPMPTQEILEQNAIKLLFGADSVACEACHAGGAPKNLPNCINFVQSDLFDKIEGEFDLITANPPYISSAVVPCLQPEVANYEPHLALDGGPQGFELPIRLVQGAAEHLKPGGVLLMEIGDDQGSAVLKAAEEAGFTNFRILKDYAGQDRILKAVKKENNLLF